MWRPRPPGSRSGLALILVLTVIMSLAIIATPFVLSMIMQEKTAVAERARRQAGYGAEGVRNFAAALLYRGAEPLERIDFEEGRGGTPYADEPAEFLVEIRDARLKDLKIRDPKGSVWGVTAHDEQGKINVFSAPQLVGDNLRDSLSRRVVDLKDFLTIYSGRPARWVRPQKIREIGALTPPNTPPKYSVTGVRVDNAMQLGLGAKVRATRPGLPPFEAKVTKNGVYLIGVQGVETDPMIPGQYLHGLLEVEMRHPVNVNTARRETLAAIYNGLAIHIPLEASTSTMNRAHTVTTEEARQIADGLYKKNVGTWHQFLAEALALDVNDLVKAAVIINAIDPGNLLLNNGTEGRGSLPYCFTSNETITIDAFAAVNTDAGTPQGSAGFREVADLGCPILLTRSWENQHDFDRMMGPPRLIVSASGTLPKLPKIVDETLKLAGLLGGHYSGYPFGARMETFPKDLDRGEPSDQTPKVQQGPAPNYISMRTERDFRGQGGTIFTTDHFDSELDGRKIDPGAFQLAHAQVFAPMPNRPDVMAGGTEFWIRFEQTPGAGGVKLFDIREADETNRISVEVILNEIVFRITDATVGLKGLPLDKGWSEIRAPFVPEKDTWYHIGAYWKGTKYGLMFLLIDGFVPKMAKWRHIDAESGVATSTEISSQMGTPADPASPFTAVPLKDSSFLKKPANWPVTEPWIVPIQIGDEVIEYDPERGLGRRGARRADSIYGPQYKNHPLNAKVTVFGYTSLFRKCDIMIVYGPPRFDPPASLVMSFGDLLPTVGKTSLRFGIPQGTVLIGEETDPNGNPMVSATNNKIRYNMVGPAPVDNTEWPDQGFIKIDDEGIYYESITREGPKAGYFMSCQRGMQGTTPANHRGSTPIDLWGFAVDTLDTNLPTPTIVQVKEEWFGPATRATPPAAATRHFWVGCVVGGKAVDLGRGPQWATASVIHETGEPLIPIFAAREIDDQIMRTNLGRHDSVTIVNSNYDKESHRICHSRALEELNQANPQNPPGTPPPPTDVALQGFQLGSLFGQAKQAYPVDGMHSRLLKWPSGELLDARWMAKVNPSVSYGPAKATLDEVKNIASSKSHFPLSRAAPPDAAQVAVKNLVNSGPPAVGAILAGEEIIGYAQISQLGEFQKCKRGWLNTAAEVHDEGDPIFLLSFLPVSSIGQNLVASDARFIPIAHPLVGQGYGRGYVLVDGEVIGFDGFGKSGLELDTLARFDGTGLFRGMFGTAPQAHPAYSMVFGIPFRYSDGYKEGQFDNRMPYFQTAHATRNARWREIRFQAELDRNDPNLRSHCYVRIDGLGDLTLPGVDEHTAVWHFFKSQQNPLDDYISSRLENGQIESRFFLEYRPGSFWPANSWKRTMKLHEVRIDYDRDTKVLLHEDK